MSVTYLLGALRCVRWFCLIAGCVALTALLVHLAFDIIKQGFFVTHLLFPPIFVLLLFCCYRFTELLLLLSLNSTLRKLSTHEQKLRNKNLSERLRKEIARRERFHQLLCRIYGEQSLTEIMNRVCQPEQTSGEVQT